MQKGKVSIIIAAYNAEQYIDECIASIYKQTYDNWDVWVCDDASTDHTLEILQRYAETDGRIHVLHNPVNMYAGASRNRCIEQCDGEYIAIQDADDVSEPDRLTKLINSIQNYAFVSSGHYLFDDSGRYKEIVPNISFPSKKDFLYGTPFCHAATLFTRKSISDTGGYRISKETRRGQDYDLFMRMYAHGYLGKNICDVLYGYRVDKETLTRRKFKYRIDECIIRYKGFKVLGLLPQGLIYVIKPIPAYFIQIIRRMRKNG